MVNIVITRITDRRNDMKEIDLIGALLISAQITSYIMLYGWLI